MATRKMPLYITIVDDHFAKCTKEGTINWTNTRHYSIEEINTELQSGREVHLLKLEREANGHYKKPDWYTFLTK